MEQINNSLPSPVDHLSSAPRIVEHPPVSILKKPMPEKPKSGMTKIVYSVAITGLGIGGALIGAGVASIAFVAIPLAVGGLIGATLAVGLFATAYLAYKFAKKFFSARSVKFNKETTILSEKNNIKVQTDFTERASSEQQIPIQRGGRGESRCKQFIRKKEDKQALIVQLEAKNQSWREGKSSSCSKGFGFTDKELKEAWEAESKIQAGFISRLNRVKNHATNTNYSINQLDLFKNDFYQTQNQEQGSFDDVFNAIDPNFNSYSNDEIVETIIDSYLNVNAPQPPIDQPIDQFIKNRFNFKKPVDLLYGKKATVKNETFLRAIKSDQEAIFGLVSEEFSNVKLEDLSYDNFNLRQNQCFKKVCELIEESEEAIKMLETAIRNRSDLEEKLDQEITQLINEHVNIVTNEEGVKVLTLIPQEAIDKLKTPEVVIDEENIDQLKTEEEIMKELFSNYSNAKLDQLNKWLKELINPSKNIFYADELEKLKDVQNKQKFDTYNNTIFIVVCESRLYQPEKILVQLRWMFMHLQHTWKRKSSSKPIL